MADDFASVLALIQETVIEPAESTHLKGLMREGLWEFRKKTFAFTNVSDTFLTVADQVEYVPGDDDVPGDIRKIRRLRILNGTSFTDVKWLSLERFRDLQASNTATSNRPRYYTWYAQKLELWPTPSEAATVYIDYQRDATRDELTGEEFTETSDTAFTNPFFKEGRDLMISYVLTRWGLGRGRDPELSQQQGTVYQLAESRLKGEYVQETWGDGCAEPHL